MDIIEKETINQLQMTPVNPLTAAYMFANLGQKNKKMSKKQLISALKKMIKPQNVMIHRDYLNNLDVAKTQALQFYQGWGHVAMNTYLRTGKIRIELNTANMSLDAISVSPSALAKNGLNSLINKQTNKFTKTLKMGIKQQKDEVEKTVQTVKLMKKIIEEAKPKIKDNIYLYRGERNYKGIYALPDDPDEVKELKYNLSQLNLQIGQHYDAPAFNSFSMAPWVALGFNGISPCCVYRMKLTSDIPHLAYPMSEMFKEYEVLLPPAVFKVVNISELTSDLSDKIEIRVYDIEFVKEL